MNNNDRLEFSLLMNQIAEATSNPEPPSPEKIDFYFEILKDLSLEQLRSNAIEYLRNNKTNRGFFPPASYLRDPRDPDLIRQIRENEAKKTLERIRYYLENFYFPVIHAASLAAIRMKMQANNEMHLFPLLQEWGNEILDAPPAVVRAQFLKSYVAEAASADQAIALPQPKETNIQNQIGVALAQIGQSRQEVGNDN